MSELPTGWVDTKLDDLGVLYCGQSPSARDVNQDGCGTPYVTGPEQWDGQSVHRTKWTTDARRVVPDGCIFITVKGAGVGTMFPGIACAIGRDVYAYRPLPQVDFHYVSYSLQHTIDEVLRNARGDIPGLSRDHIVDHSIGVPPLEEQRRIVAKLDSLRARSSRARQELDHIPKLIERYKQAILAKAFSGELIGLVPQTSHHPHPACWDLPSSWQWVRFDEAAEIASNLVPTSEVQQLPHIAPDNIGVGTGKLLAFKTVAEDGVKSPKHRFYPGQILYSKIRPYLRKAVLIDFNGVCSADMYPLNARSGVLPRYLYYWAFSPQLADFVVDHEGRTVLPKVNQVGLNQTPFPLPPEIDQEVIVSRLDAAFAWLDKIATEYARAEHLLPKLDQAILAKAFRGELVPQDPNDEPAAVLLERIRAERENGEPTRRRQARSA